MNTKSGTKKDDVFTVEYGKNNDIAIKTSRGKDTLYIKGLDDLSKLQWNIDKNDVVITNTDNSDVIRLLDYYKLNGQHSIKYLKLNNSNKIDIMSKNFIKNAIHITSETGIKKNTVNGTNFNDDINADDFIYMLKDSDNIPDTINHWRKALTINGGDGNDTITGTIYSDILSGGTGVNTLVFADEFGNDTVELTKDEKLIIDLSAFNIDNIDKLKFNNSAKHIKITVSDEDDKYGTITLKNLTKSDIVGKKGYVKIKLSNNNIIDLKNIDIFDVDVDNKSLKINGTRFSETIDASGYNKATGKKNRGVIINGDAGYNTIIATNGFNDTITSGDDGNNITAKNGNKTITTGSGADTITITGRGKRTIKAGNGKNVITINGDGKNVITTGKHRDIIVVDSDTKNSINAGSGNNDITIKGSADSVIKTGNDNDIFRIEKNGELGKTQILTGGGYNNIIVNNADSWGNLILTEEKLKAKNTITLTDNFEIDSDSDNIDINKVGDDLIIKDKYAASSITLNKYFVNNKKKAAYNFVINGKKTSVANFIEAAGGIEVKGKGIIKGTKYSDNITIKGDKAVKIYTGKGNDIVGYGKGSRTIYFNIGDGNDIVKPGWGDGKDTLVFQKGTKVTGKLVNNRLTNEKSLVISYGNKGDTVTLTNYSFTNDTRKYYYIGNKKYSISTLKGLGRSITFYNYRTTVNGTAGSDLIMDERYDYDGDKYTAINSKDGDDFIYGASNYINAGNGNDYIRTEISYVYGGKGNDTFEDPIRGGNVYYFKAGDGNDTIISSSSNLLVFMDQNSIDDLDVSYSAKNKEFVVKYNNGKDSVTWDIEPMFKAQSYRYGIQVGNKQYIYDRDGNIDRTVDDINSLNQTVLSWNNSVTENVGYEDYSTVNSTAKTIQDVMLSFVQST